jgi:hypothetical protein
VAGDGLRALANPVAAASGTLLPAMRVLGVPARVARGRPLTATIAAPGRGRVLARWRAAGGGWTERALAVGPDGRALLAIGPVDADLALVVSDGRAQSDTVRVAVEDRAFVGDVTVRAEYPAYLGRAPEALPAGDVVRRAARDGAAGGGPRVSSAHPRGARRTGRPRPARPGQRLRPVRRPGARPPGARPPAAAGRGTRRTRAARPTRQPRST